MEITKKNLLILFGEYRTFETIYPHLSGDLDKFEIMLPTWNQSVEWYDGGTRTKTIKVTEDKILEKNIIPIINNISSKFLSNTANMIYHWRAAINSITLDKISQYDNVILHRCDMVSDVLRLDLSKIQPGILYCEPGHMDDEAGFWMNDYFFVSKFDLMKSFINTIKLAEYPYPHFPLGNSILKNKISYCHLNQLCLPKFQPRYRIIRPQDHELVNLLQNLSENNIKIFDIATDSKFYKKFVQLIQQ